MRTLLRTTSTGTLHWVPGPPPGGSQNPEKGEFCQSGGWSGDWIWQAGRPSQKPKLLASARGLARADFDLRVNPTLGCSRCRTGGCDKATHGATMHGAWPPPTARPVPRPGQYHQASTARPVQPGQYSQYSQASVARPVQSGQCSQASVHSSLVSACLLAVLSGFLLNLAVFADFSGFLLFLPVLRVLC